MSSIDDIHMSEKLRFSGELGRDLLELVLQIQPDYQKVGWNFSKGSEKCGQSRTYAKSTLAKAQRQQREHFLLESTFIALFAVPPYESRRPAESGSGTLRKISRKPNVVFLDGF
jgi:hypothetical protein